MRPTNTVYDFMMKLLGLIRWRPPDGEHSFFLFVSTANGDRTFFAPVLLYGADLFDFRSQIRRGSNQFRTPRCRRLAGGTGNHIQFDVICGRRSDAGERSRSRVADNDLSPIWSRRRSQELLVLEVVVAVIPAGNARGSLRPARRTLGLASRRLMCQPYIIQSLASASVQCVRD